eukprot:CAMPEP_0113468410 /NCGR_PEP_ID=MMETSP0014_2-20120614/15340_1 /TAXON_ID=2857 /ORGANISM="Nitzschia sp." /LENGTH=234 /DNA_ID=CAMNT_0000360797 /DNA_START=162 /DNA_END=866 /DNA_ORIENTATION=+ /assembly_acc=CAM_ASM_000159
MKTVKSDSNLSDGELTAETDIDVSSIGSSSDTDINDDDDDHHLGMDIDIGIDDENDDSADTTSTSTDTTTAGVSWGPVHVREYERVVSDAATPSFGVPVGIGWRSIELPPVSIEEWETDGRVRPRRQNLKLSSITRKNMMQTVWGYSEDELRKAEQENQRIKHKINLLGGGKNNANSNKPKTMAGMIGKKVKRASWTILKGFGAASQSMTMMSSMSTSTSTSGQSSMSMGGFAY